MFFFFLISSTKHTTAQTGPVLVETIAGSGEARRVRGERGSAYCGEGEGEECVPRMRTRRGSVQASRLWAAHGRTWKEGHGKAEASRETERVPSDARYRVEWGLRTKVSMRALWSQ